MACSWPFFGATREVGLVFGCYCNGAGEGLSAPICADQGPPAATVELGGTGGGFEVEEAERDVAAVNLEEDEECEGEDTG